MLHQIARTPESEADAIASVLVSVRALIPPSPSLYYECNRERLTAHADKLAALDVELSDLRKRAFAAGTRLLALSKLSTQQENSHDLTQ